MPRPKNNIRNSSLLTAALEGLELQKQRIDEQIREVRALLGQGTGRRGRPPGLANHKRGPGRLSPAARKRIAAAQKRRWAAYRKSAAGKAE
jgi:hypothetical protein